MEDFKRRLLEEYTQLQDRFNKLDEALSSEGFPDKVGPFQYNMMILQYHGMATYLSALKLRLDNLDLTDDSNDTYN